MFSAYSHLLIELRFSQNTNSDSQHHNMCYNKRGSCHQLIGPLIFFGIRVVWKTNVVSSTSLPATSTSKTNSTSPQHNRLRNENGKWNHCSISFNFLFVSKSFRKPTCSQARIYQQFDFKKTTSVQSTTCATAKRVSDISALVLYVCLSIRILQKINVSSNAQSPTVSPPKTNIISPQHSMVYMKNSKRKYYPVPLNCYCLTNLTGNKRHLKNTLIKKAFFKPK